MTSLLRAATLATLAATVFSLASSQDASADGRTDWIGYAWQKIEIADCQPQRQILHCPLYHQKWDWKRDQWVDLTVELDLGRDFLRLGQRLTDNDRHDADHVCVTALAVDAGGANVVAHHQNWYIKAGQVEEQVFNYPSDALDRVAMIHIGSKQCRDGAHQDDGLYARVLSGIHS